MEFPKDFFEEEVRGGYKVSKEQKSIWAVLLDLLNQFDQVCRKHHLKYYLDSGTLLGAVRSKGMIPWDNDVDVVMFRHDYDLLISECRDDFLDPYFLQSFYTDKGYYRSHAQLRNSSTTGILKPEWKKVQFNQGLFIDIFVLDYVPDKDEQNGRLLKEYGEALTKEVSAAYGTNPLKLFAKKVRKDMICRRYGNESDLYRKIEGILRQQKQTEYVDKVFYRICTQSNFKPIHISDYSKELYVPFEMLQCPIPYGYDRILTLYYGSGYMTPLHQVNDHEQSGIIFDPNVPYTSYLTDNKSKERA